MVEKSFFWDGQLVGDAQAYAPYDSNEFTSYFGRHIAAMASNDFVIPGYANDLDVIGTDPFSLAVKVREGAAYVRGYYYTNDSEVILQISPNDTELPRVDRVVLRLTWADREIRLAIVEGEPSGTPQRPELEDLYTLVWEVPLFYVWVDPHTPKIRETDIHDERKFATTALAVHQHMNYDNLLENGEFLAWSGYNLAVEQHIYIDEEELFYFVPDRYVPEGWDQNGVFQPLELRPLETPEGVIPYPVYGIDRETPPEEQPRGWAVVIKNKDARSGIQQTVSVFPDDVYTLKLLLYVPSGSQAMIRLVQDDDDGTVITKTIKVESTWLTHNIVIKTQEDTTTLKVSLLSLLENTSIKIGQVMLVRGYFPGPFRPFHETIMYDQFMTTFGRQFEERRIFHEDYTPYAIENAYDVHFDSDAIFKASLDPDLEGHQIELDACYGINNQAQKIPDKIRAVVLSSEIWGVDDGVPAYLSISLRVGNNKQRARFIYDGNPFDPQKAYFVNEDVGNLDLGSKGWSDTIMPYFPHALIRVRIHRFDFPGFNVQDALVYVVGLVT